MSKLNLPGLLMNQSLFKHLSHHEIDALQREVSKQELDKSGILFRKGEAAEACYILVYGLIKLSIPSTQGQDKVMELIRPGQSFGEAMLFLDETYPFYAEALEASLLLRIPKSALLRIIENSPATARQLLAGLSYRMLGLIKNLERYSLQNATQRVIDYLLQALAEQHSSEIRLELKKNLLASLLNLTPETLSRILHQLTDQRLITVRGPRIQIGSADALKHYQRQLVLN